MSFWCAIPDMVANVPGLCVRADKRIPSARPSAEARYIAKNNKFL